MKRVFCLLLTLCLLACLLPISTMAADAEPTFKARVNNGSSYFWDTGMTPGAPARFATTTAEGVVTEAKETDDWNLKLEYPVDGTPVVTLRGATIKAEKDRIPLQISGNADGVVKIESDSTISSVNKGALYITSDGLTTITGPGKLTINTTDGICVQMAGKSANPMASAAIIKDANLDLHPTGESTNRQAISFNGGDLIIDNSKINITSTGKTLGIWGYGKYTLNADGSLKQITPTWKTGEGDTGIRNLTIQNGSVITGAATAKQFMGCTGVITIKDSTVEVTGKPVFAKKPVLEGEYSAIGGQTKDGATIYNESKFTSYRYFKLVPGTVELIPTKPTTEEPTTEPVIEPTTTPTESATEVTVPATDATTHPTNAETTPATTAPSAAAPTQPQTDEGEGGLSIAMAVLITAVTIVVLSGGTLVLLFFVIKPKWLVKK